MKHSRYLLGIIDAERVRGDELSKENQRLEAELEQVKLERQNKFATNNAYSYHSPEHATHWLQ